MRYRGLIILAVLLALLPHILFAESISASGSLTQSVTIDPTFAVGFTSKAITKVTELNQNKYNDSYEHVLSSVQTAPRDGSRRIITNADNPLYLSVVTNAEVKIRIEVGKIDGATLNNKKVLTNGSTGEIPLYIYNETFLDQMEKTNQEFTVGGGSYRAVSYPLIVYVYEADVKSAPGGEYHGTIGVTISAV